MRKKKDKNKEKRERFLRIKANRLLNVDVSFSKLSKIANKEHYFYTEEDVNILFNELDNKLQSLKNQFTITK
jgi:hypothetical protein